MTLRSPTAASPQGEPWWSPLVCPFAGPGKPCTPRTIRLSHPALGQSYVPPRANGRNPSPNCASTAVAAGDIDVADRQLDVTQIAEHGPDLPLVTNLAVKPEGLRSVTGRTGAVTLEVQGKRPGG